MLMQSIFQKARNCKKKKKKNTMHFKLINYSKLTTIMTDYLVRSRSFTFPSGNIHVQSDNDPVEVVNLYHVKRSLPYS